MADVSLTVNRMKRHLDRTLGILSALEVDNFEKKFNLAASSMKKFSDLKQEVDFDNAPNAFDPYREGINFLTKQIKENYDNLVKRYEDEISDITEELKTIRNKKKIVLYTGGRL